MEKNGLGKRINAVRKDRGLTADRLSEMCNINATYLRQIEGGVKMPSLSVIIKFSCSEIPCNAEFCVGLSAFPGIIFFLVYNYTFCKIMQNGAIQCLV